MIWLNEFSSRLRALFRTTRLDRDLEDELQSHIEMETEANIRRGLAPAEARRKALLEFGGVTQTAEAYREQRGFERLESVAQDIRYALRNFRRSPGFTAVAVLSLALGMGVNTALFSMVNMLLLRPLPVENPGELVTLTMQQKGAFAVPLFSLPDYKDIRDQMRGTFSHTIAYSNSIDGLSVDGRADRIMAEYVTGNYFTMLGLKPALGRLILPSEGAVEGADPVLVLGYTYWKSRFAGDPNIIGKRVSIDGHPVTVVGVAPKSFHGAQAMVDIQAYLPLGMNSLSNTFLSGQESNRSVRNLYVLGRLGPGISLSRAQSRLKVVAANLAAVYPKYLADVAIRAEPQTTGKIPNGEGLVSLSAVFLAMAALVLLLACVNLANLLMVRATVRRKEVAMRAALGCSRARLIRQFLTESMLLAFFGAAVGLLFAAVTCDALSSLHWQGIPIYLDFSFDGRVFAFALAATLFTGLALGIVPALRGTRVDLIKVARESGSHATPGRLRMRSALVTAQVAASFLLLMVATLLARSLDYARRLDLGFDAANVVNFSMDPHHVGYTDAQGNQFYRELLTRVRALPGVESAGLAVSGPMSAYPLPGQVNIEGYTLPRGQTAPTVFYDMISQGLLETLRIPVTRGRSFQETDNEKATRVALVNETFANRFFGGRDPIGRRIQFAADPTHWIEVVGVIHDSQYLVLSELHQPYFFLPFEQNYASIETLHVRASGATDILVAEVEKEVARLAPGLPVAGVETMQQHLESSTGFLGMRVEAGFSAALGGLGLALALLGLYGVVSYSAAQRTHEIGIRIALGAGLGEVRRLVLSRGLWIVAIGLPVGLLLSLAATPVVRGLLLGINATDPLTYVAVALAIACVTLAACYVPARRAMRTDPADALRHD